MTLNLDTIYRQLLALNAQVGALIAQVKAEMPPEDKDGQERERVFGKVRRDSPDLTQTEAPKGLPAVKDITPTPDPTNVGRTFVRSKAAERALDARNQLKKLNRAGLKELSDEKLSQMARALGLDVRGTGASGDVTRGDYVTALEGRLPIPVKGAGRG